MLTSPVAAARAAVATGAWVKSKHDMYLIRASVGSLSFIFTHPPEDSKINKKISEHKKRKAFGGFPYYNMACLLDVRKIQTTGEYTGRVNQQITTASRSLLPVHTEPVPSRIFCT